MNKKLFYITCICIKPFSVESGWAWKNITEFHEGDVLYYNLNATAQEMYVLSKNNPYKIYSSPSYLPFTRLKKNAKKYKQRKYCEEICKYIESKGFFKCEIKEINVIYQEDEED